MSAPIQEPSLYRKRFLTGNALTSLGSGLTLPILVVYLHQMHGISISTASLVLAWMSVLGLLFAGVIGYLVDHYGPKPVLLTAIVIQAGGVAAWSIVHSLVSVFAVAAIVSLGQAGTWPPQSTLMARMVPEEERQRFFGLQFMMLNLGLGVGGLLSALIVDVHDPSSFTRLFLLDAFSFLAYFAVVVSMRGVGNQIERTDADKDEDGGYREVLRDRRFVRLSITKFFLMLCGYASLDAGLPALLTTYGGLSVKMLGPLWAFNTAAIVIGQVYVLNRLEGRSRTRLLSYVALFFAVSWIVVGIGMAHPRATFVLAACGMVIFACGEMIWSSVGPTLTNELAPEHLRGRYNAVDGLTWVTAGAIGPIVSGLMLQRALYSLWIALIVLGLAVAFLLSLRLRQFLTPAQDGQPSTF